MDSLVLKEAGLWVSGSQLNNSDTTGTSMLVQQTIQAGTRPRENHPLHKRTRTKTLPLPWLDTENKEQTSPSRLFMDMTLLFSFRDCVAH